MIRCLTHYSRCHCFLFLCWHSLIWIKAAVYYFITTFFFDNFTPSFVYHPILVLLDASDFVSPLRCFLIIFVEMSSAAYPYVLALFNFTHVVSAIPKRIPLFYLCANAIIIPPSIINALPFIWVLIVLTS